MVSQMVNQAPNVNVVLAQQLKRPWTSGLLWRRPIMWVSTHDDVMAWKRLFYLLVICEGNPPVTGGFPHKGTVMRGFGDSSVVSSRTFWNKLSGCGRFEMISRLCDVSTVRTSPKIYPQFGCALSCCGWIISLCGSIIFITSWDKTPASPPGPRLNIKTVLSTYGDFQVKDKTAVRTSYL